MRFQFFIHLHEPHQMTKTANDFGTFFTDLLVLKERERHVIAIITVMEWMVV
jgi:hypothetical protein